MFYGGRCVVYRLPADTIKHGVIVKRKNETTKPPHALFFVFVFSLYKNTAFYRIGREYYRYYCRENIR